MRTKPEWTGNTWPALWSVLETCGVSLALLAAERDLRLETEGLAIFLDCSKPGMAVEGMADRQTFLGWMGRSTGDGARGAAEPMAEAKSAKIRTCRARKI